MNICKQLNYSNFFFLALVAHVSLIAMDHPQLQLENANQKPVVYGKLFIDPIENPSSSLYPHHILQKNNPVEYLTPEHRQLYPHAKQFINVPLSIPFVHVIIAPKNNPTVKIFTVMPATQFLNCTDESITDIISNKCTFRLTCAKNNDLVIKQKYAPKDDANTVEKQGITFKKQFESCMNQFYAKLPYGDSDPNIQELIQNGIVHHEVIEGFLPMGSLLISFTIHRHTHGIHGCTKSQDLINLATEQILKPHGNSAFNFVMNRKNGLARPQEKRITPAEQYRYHCKLLEVAKNVSNKSPMPKTTHTYKSPALDVDNKIFPTPDNDDVMLDTILEDCLIEFAAQQNPTRPSTRKGDCAIL